MKRVGIIGGETHIGEITQLSGKRLEIVGCALRPDQGAQAAEQFNTTAYATIADLLAETQPEIAAIANENDLKAAAVVEALEAGCDVVVDKPLAIRMEEQERIEAFLNGHPERRLLMLLTLRGQPEWAGLRRCVRDGLVGEPAFVHVRMAVRLKRSERPPWFLDVHRSGGLFLDLLVHGIDMVEWATGHDIVAISAVTGNLGEPTDAGLRDHAALFCELANGSSAVVEGQRMLPDTVGSDYRMTVAGTRGFADLRMGEGVRLSSPSGADVQVQELPEPQSVVADWLAGGDLVGPEASLRANYLAIRATQSAKERSRLEV